MKKNNFIALCLGTVSLILFALGMCMTLLPAWNAFREGIILGVVGILLGVMTLILWRKKSGKTHISRRTARAITVGILGALVLGTGMCFCMVWQQLLWGVLIGIVGILMLLMLIPIIKGLQ